MKKNKWMAGLIAVTLAGGILPAANAAPEAGQGQSVQENLALGKPYQLTSPYPRDLHFSKTEDVHGDDTGAQLTDGVFGGTVFSDKAYVGRLWQGSREVTIDLGETASVNEIRVSVLQDNPVGIFFPDENSYSISVNGTAWKELGTVKNSLPSTEKGPVKQIYERSSVDTQARYVKVNLPVESWLFIDEIEVIGTKDASGKQLIPAPRGPKPESGYPLQGSAQAGGIKHEVLIFTGEWQYQPADWISFTKDDFKPYVSYVDTDMKRKDFMFDGFLFMPYAPLPDGANYGPTAGKPTNKGHFEKLLDRLFRDDYELGALNEAVKEAKADLPDRNYEAKVVIPIPYPRVDQSDFGDVDGDGVSENLKVAEVGEAEAYKNRLKVVKWYIDEVYKRWNAKGFSDLQLVSFYWYNEFVARQLSDMEDELLQATSEYVHSKGAKFQWIPYYFARGWEDWKKNGFDAALMQPNYMFHSNAGTDRVDSIAKAALENGMGVEIEMSDAVLTDEAMRNRYYTYLDKGKEYHYMQQSFSAFYQQVKTLWRAARSENPVQREVYDRTYEYIKGTYKPRQ
ncbi:DUF4855 domain-containing protein [Paenibacillus sp. GD4]|uniref:DUF4855 domain-containing protein n=1 Tax=Paenibacillus sp. GD4 TaxID=3068890 RepID=UPI0027966C6F|nr:DUF4855 domain-containing protein [Paenibacillus sp. GD4]MDQ1913524.1 DUF4855 domain-containing protein [Paenibacillus sp. GD4]